MRAFLIFFIFMFLPLSARAATCDAGQFLKDGACVDCVYDLDPSAPVYCPGDDKRYDCPNPDTDWYTLIGYNLINLYQTDAPYGNGVWSNDGSHPHIYVAACYSRNNFIDDYGNVFLNESPYNAENNIYWNNSTLWFVAGSGYYLADYVWTSWQHWYGAVKPCTNAPANAHYTGPGTPDSADGTIVDANDCTWQCDSGYGRTANDTCEPLCAAGITRLRTSTGLIYNLYANQLTSPAIHIQQNGITCYVNLVPGGATGAINIRHNDTVYHATN